jgi:nucleoside-diphosphate-sugar epimerase
MKVLLTGAFGNIGLMTLNALLDAGHQVRCFDIETPLNIRSKNKSFRVSRFHPSRIELVWGDICNSALVDQVSKGVDAVIHLAAIIPPVSEEQEALSRKVNITATQNLLAAVGNHSPNARFIFASTVGVYGYQQPDALPKTADDPVSPVNVYGKQKVLCEEMIQRSGLKWLILRLGVCFDSKFALQANLATIRMQFAVRPEIRIEQIHPKDVALALANAVTADNVDNKILLLGGGESCRTTSGDLIQGIFNVIGVKLPVEIYGTGDFYTEWMDTAESQRLLRYQWHTLPETIRELSHKLRFVNLLLIPFRPIVPLVFKWMLRPGLTVDS